MGGGVEFFQTGMGHRFYEGTMPHLVRAVERMAKAMERANRLKEKELELAGAKPEPEPEDAVAEKNADERYGDGQEG